MLDFWLGFLFNRLAIQAVVRIGAVVWLALFTLEVGHEFLDALFIVVLDVANQPILPEL